MAVHFQNPHLDLTDSPAESVEAGLRASFLDALAEAVVGTDQDGHIIYWNDAAERLFGWRADEVLGSPAADILLAQGTDRDAALVLRVLRRVGSWSGEFMVCHRDGRLFPVLVTASTVSDAQGNAVGMVGVSRDISSQRQAEETARTAEERLEMVHRAAAAVIWELDVATGRVVWNDAVADAFGYPAEDVEPSMEWWRSKIHDHDRSRVGQSFERFLRDSRRFWTDEYRVLTADRGYATVFERAYLSCDDEGRPVRVVGTTVDLTERRRIHEEQRFLAQTSMILDLSIDYESTLPTIARLAVNTVADCCLIALTGNDGFPPFLTAAHADARLQPIVDDLASFAAAGPPAGSIREQVVKGGEAILIRHVPDDALAQLAGDSHLARAISELAPRSAMVVPLSARRRSVGYAILASSSPDRIYDEGDLRMAEELGRRLGLSVDHAHLFQSAELANRAKSDFLAIISHELRTPLTAVLGYSELLSEEVAGSLNAVQRKQVSRIRAGSDRLLRLIEGILTFARLETGRDRPQLAPVDLTEILRHTEDMVRTSALDKGIEFQLSLDALPATIRTDAERVGQILLALLTNAIKFTDQGAVRVHAGTMGDEVFVDVRDTGPGIPTEHLAHIFNPFWQAEQPSTRRAGGAGLGLSVARRLARLLHGDVMVASTEPGSTTFRLVLPIAPPA
jgi:PAS domain S-box-containing protein